MRELALFAGAGGGILGGKLLGWRTVCAVEIDAYCRRVLLARQRDGHVPRFPIWDDICTFDGHPWSGSVDVVSGGFPCQDISAAGKGEGITGKRSSLWSEMARVIREVRPRYAFVENSPMLASRGLGTVLGDLAEMGFDARWGVLSACAVGAPHTRERLWIVANSIEDRQKNRLSIGKNTQYAPHGNRMQNEAWDSISEQPPAESLVDGAANGLAHRVDRLEAIGNGQVPAVAALAWSLLSQAISPLLRGTCRQLNHN